MCSHHNGVHFFDISTSKTGPRMVCFVHVYFEMCFAPQRHAIFHLSSGHLAPHPPLWRACFSTLRSPPGSSFFWLFLFLLLFSSLTLPISAFHLSILSEVWLLNFLRWTLKQLAQLTLVSTALALDLTLARFELHPIHSLCQVQQGRIWCVALAMAAWRGCWPLTGSWAHQQRSVGIGSWRIQDLTSGLWTPVGIHLLLLCWFSGAQHQQLAILTRKAPTIWGMCRARGSTQRRSRGTATMKVMWHEWKAVCGRASLLRDLQGSGWQRQPRRLVRLRGSWSWTGHAAGGLRCHLGCHLWSLGRRRRLNWYSRCANSRAQWARLSSRKLWDWWNWLWHWRKYLGCRWRRAPWCWKWGRWPFWRWRWDAWTWVWWSWKGHRWGGRGGSSRRWCHGCCGCPHILLQGIGSQNWDKYTHKVRNLRRGGRKPAPSRNLFCSANCLAPNPNGRCSLLSFGSAFFFNMLASMFLAFSKLCLSSMSCLFPECVARVPVSLRGSGGWGCVRSMLRLRSQHSNLFYTLYTLHSKLYTLHSSHHTPHSTLYTPHSTLDTPHPTLYTLHSTLYTPRFILHTLHFTLYTWHSTLYTPHCALYTVHSSLQTPHSKLRTTHFPRHTPHSTLYTLHSTLYTLHTTLYTLHSSLYTPYFTRYTLHSSLLTADFTRHTPHFTLHTLHFTLYTLHSTLYTPHFTLYTPYSTLYTPHSTLYTLRSTLHTLHFTHYTLHSTLFTLHSILYTLHSTLLTAHLTLHTPHSTRYTLHFTLYTLHSTLHTLHVTLYTPHSSLQTLHATLHTLHSTLYTLHSTLYTLQSTLHTLNFTHHTPHFTLHTAHSTLYAPHLHSSLLTAHFTLYTPHSTLSTPHSTLYTLHFTLYTLHSTLYTLHCKLHTLHFTLHTLHFKLYTWHSTIYTTPHSILHTPHSTLSTPHSTLYTLHLTLQTLHFTLCTLHFTLCTLHSTLYAPHFTLYTVHSPHNSLHFTLSPPTVMILSPLVHRLLEAQTICSTFGIVFLALQPFATPSSVSLLIPLQTLLFRTPTDAALRWASEFLHFSVFPLRFSFIFPWFFPTFFLPFLHFPPFSPCFQQFSFIFLGFFLPFSCRSQRT